MRTGSRVVTGLGIAIAKSHTSPTPKGMSHARVNTEPTCGFEGVTVVRPRKGAAAAF